MAKKKKLEKIPRELTKRQLSRWQHQKKRQSIILGAGIFIIAAALVIMVVGWYIGEHRPLHQTAIRENDTEFNMKYYVQMLRLHGTEQSADLVKDIEQNELIRQGALKVGVSVSDKEVREELKRSNLPANDIGKDLTRSKLLRDKLLDEYFEEQVPVSAEQRHVIAMLLESESQAAEVKGRIEAGEDFRTLAGELSLESLSKEKIIDFLKRIDHWNAYTQEYVKCYLGGELEKLKSNLSGFPSRQFSVIDRRDRILYERMLVYLKKGNAVVFVGARHIRGITDMLRESGYQIVGCGESVSAEP